VNGVIMCTLHTERSGCA